MIRRPPRSTQSRSSAASDVYKRQLHDISTADIWRVSSKGAGSAELLVGQGRGPETAVVTSGDATALTNVTVTLTWAQKPWFFEALAMAVIGAIVAAFALIDVSNSRRTARWAHAARTRRSRVRT